MYWNTMLIMLEELLNTVKKGVSYVMTAPIDEGSEVFGQYALLCTQELKRRGYNVTLRPFYMEDIVKRDDYTEIYRDMLDTEASCKIAQENADNAKNYYVLGEPMCVYKPYIIERNRKAVGNSQIICMPLSELLLFHMLEIDRKHEFTVRLKNWKAMHDEAMNTSAGSRIYTEIEKLQAAADKKLDFCIGDGGKYRFAKLLSLTNENADAAVLLNSSEENTAIILKQIIAAYRAECRIPFIQIDLDYEHAAGREDFELI